MLLARSLPAAVAALGLCTAVAAQTVTATARTAAAFDVTAKLAALALPITRAMPAGMAIDKVDASVTLGNAGRASASVRGAFQVTDTAIDLELTEALDAYTATSSVWVGPARYLLTVAASATVPAVLELEWRLSAAVGTPLPRIEVDVGNDGFFDLVAQQPNTTLSMPLPLGQAPQQLLLRTSSIAFCSQSPQALQQTIHLRVRPAARGTVTSFTPPCGATSLRGLPTFDGSLWVRPEAMPAMGLLLFVLGGSPSPIPLPGNPTCLLVPTADFLGVMTSQGVLLPMASVPPLRLWAQGVLLEPAGGLVGTNSLVLDYR